MIREEYQAKESLEERLNLISHIKELCLERDAIILAHNYQRGEVQDIADFVGDSLGLSQEAAKTKAKAIVFCGVHFMAETAAILCPDKIILLPDLEAGCSLAATISAEQLRDWKGHNPGAVVVSYVNTTAEVKSESDYCCTSSNAEAVIRSIPEDKEILFCPDMFLGSYLEKITKRKMHIWMGECHVHAGIDAKELGKLQLQHPNAELLVHPECGCTSSTLYRQGMGDLGKSSCVITSTEGMMRRAAQSKADSFIVATEVGILHRMQKFNPEKTFIPASAEAICPYMKKITLEKITDCLKRMSPQVTVPTEIASKARKAINRMLEC